MNLPNRKIINFKLSFVRILYIRIKKNPPHLCEGQNYTDKKNG